MARKLLARVRSVISAIHAEFAETIAPHVWADDVFERLLVTLSFIMALWVLNPATTALYGGLYQPLIHGGVKEGVWGLIFLVKALFHVAIIQTHNRILRGWLCVVSIGLWGFVAFAMVSVNWRSPTIIYASVPVVLAFTALGRLVVQAPKVVDDATVTTTP